MWRSCCCGGLNSTKFCSRFSCERQCEFFRKFLLLYNLTLLYRPISARQVWHLDVFFSAIVSSAIGLVWSRGSLTASRKIHDTLLENVIKAPIGFFDNTPLGRIMGRCEWWVRARVSTTTVVRICLVLWSLLLRRKVASRPFDGGTVTRMSPDLHVHDTWQCHMV